MCGETRIPRDMCAGNTHHWETHITVTPEVLHITCNMCTRDLPDMYALSPRASDIHIRQIPRAHVTTIT